MMIKGSQQTFSGFLKLVVDVVDNNDCDDDDKIRRSDDDDNS